MAEHANSCNQWRSLPEPHGQVAVLVEFMPVLKCYGVSHRGKPAELIASGAVPATALQPYDRSKTRADEYGDMCRISQGSLTRSGRITVFRYKDFEGAAKLLGVTPEILQKVRETTESARNRDAERDSQRGEDSASAKYMALDFIEKLQPMSSTDAMRFLGDLYDLVTLPKTRKDVRKELRQCFQDDLSLHQTAVRLRNLPPLGEVTMKTDEPLARRLRLVVDNTRQVPHA